MEIVEVGMKLDNSISYYHDLLIKNGLRLDFCCITHDIYYTKEDLNGLTENQMKNSCIRIRYVTKINVGNEGKSESDLLEKEQKLISDGYVKIFDTIKFDYQYCNDTMKSKVQLQDIKDIGLLVYYDNPDYYSYPAKEQINLLLKELNTYGFNFKENDLGIDKLRTLYYKKEMFSDNQNT